MGQFFSVVLFIILGFYLLGAILRLVLRVWLARKMKDFEKKGTNFGGGFYSFGQQYSKGKSEDTAETTREGEVKVERTDSEQRKINEKVGEYVDFDEIK